MIRPFDSLRSLMAGGLIVCFIAGTTVNAQMPTPNPKYDPAKAEYNPPPKKAKQGMK